MKIHTSGGEDYLVEEQTITVFFANILAYILSEYEKLPDHLKLLAMTLTRGILLMAELKEQDAEKKKLLRPENKRTDPNIHLIKFLLHRLAAVVPALEIEVEANEHRVISAVSFKNSDTSRGQIPLDGGFRQWENDGSQAARQASSPVVSNTSALHSG